MKICIVAHNAYRLMSGNTTGHIGGVELQSSMMARWFANAGHETSLITWAEGDSTNIEEIDGVTVIKTCRQDAGIRLVRFFYPRWSSLINALGLADADIYYQNGAEYVTGQVAHWCRRNHKKFVFSVASDADCQANLPLLPSLREKILYKYGLKNADQVIVQTTDQQRNLQDNFERDSRVIPMPCDMERRSHTTREEHTAAIRHVVLIGRLSREKNVEMFIDIAGELPEYNFSIIGPDGSEPLYVSQLRSQASKVGNVEFLGAKDRKEIRCILQRSSLLCCTSRYEGFPNTFLEAWSQGVPVVSTIDPDGVLEREGIGVHIPSASAMAVGIRNLLESAESLAEMKKASENYYDKTHFIEAAIPRFVDAFELTLVR